MPIFSVDELRFQQTDIEAVKKESLRPDRLDEFLVRFRVYLPSVW